MMKGEYIGKDGRTYRWERQHSLTDPPAQGDWFKHFCVDTGRPSEGPYVSDLPAAKAALDELIEGEEWVEWETPENYLYRADANGNVERKYNDSESCWSPASLPVRVAYRKGLSVGHEDVQELVEAVEDADYPDFVGHRTITEGNQYALVLKGEWLRILIAARKCKS